MRLQVKDKVKMTDASYSYMVCDGELNGSWDSVGCTQKEYEIVAMNCVLPTDNFRVCLKNVPDNDTIIRRLSDGVTVFTQERFLSLIERPKRKVKKVMLIRPYTDRFTGEIDLTVHFKHDFQFCGPIQNIEIEVEE